MSEIFFPHSINPESFLSSSISADTSVTGWSLTTSGSLDWPSGSVLTSFGASTTTFSTISDPSAALSGTASDDTSETTCCSTTVFFLRFGGM